MDESAFISRNSSRTSSGNCDTSTTNGFLVMCHVSIVSAKFIFQRLQMRFYVSF
ncbi:unnamed protein product [Acanthoscelides obtectus]|uniref:Uncharacterized protein n=1 Tax=Acanthoscelides obtectus TaxID=200917 RepID=A0A9P0M0X0_ACAOB|nr:unnamed protein product [Acanthoscelides obtectus]CAK1654780.1 hypothetical protein AOBTE_LOCUS18838 [Acanthoscelides obtectus]